ncbi:MAG: class II fumarate hydratase [Chloroflexota bacterium]
MTTLHQRPPRRVERDSMGELEVPEGAYYGASTMRAVQNFPISDLRFNRNFIRALGLIKRAAALVNQDMGLLDDRRAQAVASAAQEVADGAFDDQFVVDIFQTGSGTSTNMNANEVIANRAIEILGDPFGSRGVHPNDHVNIGQSSNDVIPTAIHLAALLEIANTLTPALEQLSASLHSKADELMPIIKTGRTHLQDATPIRLGQEFLGFAGQIERALSRVRYAQEELSDVALGGTAVGTGINMPRGFPDRVCAYVNEATGLSLRETENHFQAQSTLDGCVAASGVMNTIAVSLMKIANDLRWMGSGPRAGIGEIDLPAVQPGSSIMPGKVNPVIPESVCQVAAQVMGNHTTVTVAGQSGNFEINVMMPVVAYNLLQSINLLGKAAKNLDEQCIRGIVATSHGPAMIEQGLMLGTALAPVVGYDTAADIAKEAAKSNRTIREVAREKTSLTEDDLNRILDPAPMTEPGFEGAGGGG